jgi:TPR repeat protein
MVSIAASSATAADLAAPDHCRWKARERNDADLICQVRGGGWAVVSTTPGFDAATVAAARAGDARAMVQMGMFYLEPDPRVHDPAAAMGWFRKAAGLGDPGAMGVIGVMYERGDGVAQNPTEAARWTRMAAEAGSPIAMYLLATLFEQGYGVPKDDVEAARWYRAAADKGEPGGMAGLSRMYQEGRGVPKDDAESKRWWARYEEAVRAQLKSMGDSAPRSDADPSEGPREP